MQEFFTNSAHFPLANVILEFLIEDSRKFFISPDPYLLLTSGMVQAFVLGSMQHAGRSVPLLGNLVGPAFYTIAEISLEGFDFFNSPYHVAYWVFSLLIGLFQQARVFVSASLSMVLMLAENVVRTGILLAMYWIFEGLTHPKYLSLEGFMEDDSHAFIAIVILLTGLMMGFSNVAALRYLAILQETAAKLKEYSEWLLGRELLSKAVENPSALSLHRMERTVVFVDIRGFTTWSESKPPEEVVAMLNEYFEAADAVWPNSNALKIQYIGDEIMAVFPGGQDAAKGALELGKAVGLTLDQYGLGAGIGVNTGAVVEGLMGSRNLKGYNVIGDVVNSAKRICDQASTGEVLISKSTSETLGTQARLGERRDLVAKGKSDPIQVFPLLGLD